MDLFDELAKDLVDNVDIDYATAIQVSQFLRDNDIVSEETLEEIYE